MHGLARGVSILRGSNCAVEVLSGEMTEERVIARLAQARGNPDKQPLQLVLVPWHKYFLWNKLEGYLGLTRNHGPTVAGYLAEKTAWKDLPASRSIPRVVLLDLSQLDPQEWARVVRAAGVESSKSGINGLLSSPPSSYAETWLNGTLLGPRIDGLAILPEVRESPEWVKRLPTARILLSSLWSMIFDEGSGKSDFNLPPKIPKAFFQTGIDPRAWVFRLCFSGQNLGQAEILRRFWPQASEPTALPQLLIRYSDLLRVHWAPENNAVEITCALFQSAPSVQHPQAVRTLWIDPAQSIPTNDPLAKPFPLGGAAPVAVRPTGPDERSSKALNDAALKLREMTQNIRERDEIIKELRAGGVGSAAPLPPPDTEALLETFQFRFAEAEDELRRLESAVQGADPADLKGPRLAVLQKRISVLTEMEKNWIRSIATTLERYKSRRAAGGG